MEQKFRVHHILCTSLYEGKGYSGTFCENMTAIVEWLQSHRDEPLELVAEPDMICAGCPNRTAANECEQDDNHVAKKDRLLLTVLGLEEGGSYTYRELCERTLDKMTEKAFLESCGGCYWRKQGLCRYENLVAQLKLNASSY